MIRSRQIHIDVAGKSPWKLQKLVLPQDTDHAGVMWHGSYLNWLEEARVEALNQVGLPYGQLSKKGYEMPVVSLEVNYILPLLHGDLVGLESWSLPQQGVRWPWVTNFLKGGDIAATARVDLVLVKRNSSRHQLVRRIPKEISLFLQKLQLNQ